jgi:hypothetical protein
LAQKIARQHHDVVVIGGGSAGIAAAVSAASNGADTLLVDAGPMIGGELLSGIPIDGCLNTRGEWVIGGVGREFIDECDRLGGYVGAMFHWRSIWVVCCDPEIMKIAVINVVKRAGVKLLLYTFAEDVVVEDGRVVGVVVLNKNQRTLVTADVFLDCSGDGDVAMMAGAAFEAGSDKGEFQPVSMVFRIAGVETAPFLDFVRKNPDNIAVKENPWITQSREECVEPLVAQGFPKVFFKGEGPLLSGAIKRSDMYPTALVGITPVSTARKEVSLNTTRIANVDATKTDALSNSLPSLLEQVWICQDFLKRYVPGFENAHFAGIAPRIGIRETRRIIGETTLTIEDVLDARKLLDGVAKGAHHVDVHGAGTHQLRRPIRGGGSYDIPLGCLIPKGLRNLMLAGRCLSATREAHGSARVMGTCMAMGQAIGTAAAMCTEINRFEDVRELPVGALRSRLLEQGAVLDGTH